MKFAYLRAHHMEFVHELEALGYRKKYRQAFEAVIRQILDNAESNGWDGFDDVYAFYSARGLSKHRLSTYAGIIGALKNFDEQHILPVLGKRVSIANKGKYDNLPCEFKSLINYCEEIWKARENSPNTTHSKY